MPMEAITKSGKKTAIKNSLFKFMKFSIIYIDTLAHILKQKNTQRGRVYFFSQKQNHPFNRSTKKNTHF